MLQLLGRKLNHHKMAENLTKVLYVRGHETIDFMKEFIIHLHVTKKTGPEKRKVREGNVFQNTRDSSTKGISEWVTR
ncbi:hypothetical protein CapIbe_017667 [Capra ibex]